MGRRRVPIGAGFQAKLPTLMTTPPPECEKTQEEVLSTLWVPCVDDDEEKLDKYLETAQNVYKYTSEQALALLQYHRHDCDAATEDLKNFRRIPNEWTDADKLRFAEAQKNLEDDFATIRLLYFPNKSLASVIDHYYTCKKGDQVQSLFRTCAFVSAIFSRTTPEIFGISWYLILAKFPDLIHNGKTNQRFVRVKTLNATGSMEEVFEEGVDVSELDSIRDASMCLLKVAKGELVITGNELKEAFDRLECQKVIKLDVELLKKMWIECGLPSPTHSTFSDKGAGTGLTRVADTSSQATLSWSEFQLDGLISELMNLNLKN